jgi:dTDP-4-dehydrorhamnose reductase
VIKVLVTGSDGMLGTDLISALSTRCDVEVLATTISDLDITNPDQVAEVLNAFSPAIIFHGAAYTAVDKAESEPELSEKVNAFGTRNLAFWAQRHGARFVYVSTDYVFNGEKKEPYTEKDSPDPLGVYGKSKLLGEIYLQTLVENFLIVRTSWLCGANGPNFVATMLRLGVQKSEISVVDDQQGRPTFTFDLAQALIFLGLSSEVGVCHVSNSGQASWFEFAQEIFKQAKGAQPLIHPISSSQYATVAKRPMNSILDLGRLEGLGLALPHWKDSLGELLRRMKESV